MKILAALMLVLIGPTTALADAQVICYDQIEFTDLPTAYGYSAETKSGTVTIIPLNANVNQVLNNEANGGSKVCLTGTLVNSNLFAFDAQVN
jgi:hypothetical protein